MQAMETPSTYNTRRSISSESSGSWLEWYEILTCCCKWGAECKSCVTICFLYYFSITLIVSLTAACFTLGIIAAVWDTCRFETMLPYWVIVSGVTQFFLFLCIKALKEEYQGVTLWRILAMAGYLAFLIWLIRGNVWTYNTWGRACDSSTCKSTCYVDVCSTTCVGNNCTKTFHNVTCNNECDVNLCSTACDVAACTEAADGCCNIYLKYYAFILTFLHWIFAVLGLIPQIFILMKVCCCQPDSVNRPLKPSFVLKEDIY